MKRRIAAAALFACVGSGVWVQSAGSWKMPRTDGGAPDLQGVTWNFSTMTPLERPAGVEKAVLTEVEATAFEQQFAARQTATTNNGYEWWDGGAAHLDRLRTSLIIDPLDGHLPPQTPEARRRFALRPAAVAGGPEDFPLNSRCIWWQNAGPPMIPSPYNNNLQFIQTRDYIVIATENIHDARIIRMGGRPHAPVRQWAGDSKGQWERDTLVVETVNFSAKTSLRGSDENLRLIERFTLIDANTLDYQFTADDPSVWTRAWTAALRLHRTTDQIYEFACHEGNARTMEGMLKTARLP